MLEKICETDILGTKYSLFFGDPCDDIKLESLNGYMDFTDKRIVVSNIDNDDPLSVNVPNNFKQTVIRHEVIHAFVNESGLDNLNDLDEEQIVQWIAVQFPKISNTLLDISKKIIGLNTKANEVD